MRQNSQVRVVDGVSSHQTYVVIATNGDMRLALRYLYFGAVKERNRSGLIKEDGKPCYALICKAHIERDARQRVEVSERSFTKFGLPDVAFMYKHNRFTGVIEVPFAYLPATKEKLEQMRTDTDFVTPLWSALTDTAVENGAELACTQREFRDWLHDQWMAVPLQTLMNDEEKAARGAPTVRAWWQQV